MSEAQRCKVLLVTGVTHEWDDVIAALRDDCVSFESIASTADPDEVAARVRRDDVVVVVDLAPDVQRGMATVQSCRRLAPRAPVVVAAVNPTLDLARRIRLAGVFYLALKPVAADEMRTVLHDARECMGTGRAGASMCRAKTRLLIIDDDADFAASTRAALEAQGYVVSWARSGREGLEVLGTEPPDLVILDVMMEHDWAGYEVNQAVRYGSGFEGVRHIPILMVSSIPVDPATRFAGAGEMGMVCPDAYMTKPLEIGAFLAKVRALVGPPQAQG